MKVRLTYSLIFCEILKILLIQLSEASSEFSLNDIARGFDVVYYVRIRGQLFEINIDFLEGRIRELYPISTLISCESGSVNIGQLNAMSVTIGPPGSNYVMARADDNFFTRLVNWILELLRAIFKPLPTRTQLTTSPTLSATSSRASSSSVSVIQSQSTIISSSTTQSSAFTSQSQTTTALTTSISQTSPLSTTVSSSMDSLLSSSSLFVDETSISQDSTSSESSESFPDSAIERETFSLESSSTSQSFAVEILEDCALSENGSLIIQGDCYKSCNDDKFFVFNVTDTKTVNCCCA